MTEEYITRESLVDMFASFDSSYRAGILKSLDQSIAQTEDDVTSGSVPVDKSIQVSMKNLEIMRECCQQAQTEFDELSKKVK